MTRNGKIARLPKAIRDELNRRIDENEQGKSLVDWLNSLPEVPALMAAEFDGKPIREQNLSEWKKGGFCDWQLLQERRGLLQSLEENAKAIRATVRPKAIMEHLSLVLTAELAQVIQDLAVLEMDPRERAQSLAKIIGRFAQLRREESNACRVEVVREQWDTELEKREEYKRTGGEYIPLQALLLQQMYISTFSQPALRSWHGRDADSIPGTEGLNPGKSD